MGGVDVGEGSAKRRSTNSDINMVPFIDLLMVTIAFLLITAVWVTSSRIDTNAEAAARAGCEGHCEPPPKTLHVHLQDDRFVLAWKDGSTLLSERTVPRSAAQGAGAEGRYGELAKAVASEWQTSGLHRDPNDGAPDRVVLHTDDRAPFHEVIAVLDAIAATRRDVRTKDGRTAAVPAFATTFAAR